jgi:hypothetical protein
MHEHAGTAGDAATLLHVLVLCSVLAATLFVCRRLAEDWPRLQDRFTPATHAGMGAAMLYTMLAPPARPVLVGAGAVFALVAGALCRRAVGRGPLLGRSERASLLATSGTTLVMALMLLVAERGAAMTLVLLVCLVGCAMVYIRSAARSPRIQRQHAPDGSYLAMTTSMAVMVAGA